MMEGAGSRLKKIRLEKGISLEEVQKNTKIHLNILKAIEGDSLTNLSPVYLKGFLKIYCKFLGVDHKEFISDYKETQTQVTNIVQAKIVSDRPAMAKAFLRGIKIKLASFKPTEKVKRLSIFILIVIFLALGLFNLGKSVASKRRAYLKQKELSLRTPVKAADKREQRPQQTKAVTLAPKPPSAKVNAQKEALFPIRLNIRAHENCWVYLKADGRVLFRRVLEKGRFESWQAKERIELSLGNAGAVELEVNGQLFSNLGRRGQVRRNIVITKEGINIGK